LILGVLGRARDQHQQLLKDIRLANCIILGKGFLVVYAIVRAGGRQEKVEVGTVVVLDRIKADKDGNVQLVPVLHVDGTTITHDAKKLANITVTAEVVGDLRGPKIVIQKFKNKTGYKKRQGHRQELTRVKITSIK
jgi:large subunit ribosomal protein L21